MSSILLTGFERLKVILELDGTGNWNSCRLPRQIIKKS